MTKFFFRPWLSVKRSSFSLVDADTVAEIWDSSLMGHPHQSEVLEKSRFYMEKVARSLCRHQGCRCDHQVGPRGGWIISDGNYLVICSRGRDRTWRDCLGSNVFR